MKTALLVIDVQNSYSSPESELFCAGHQTTTANINKLVQLFQKNDFPIFYIRHIHKADGSDLGRMFDYTGGVAEEFGFIEGSDDAAFDKDLLKIDGAVEITKNRYSAFVETPLNERLKALGVERVIICGYMTNFCCETTARHAHDLDYYVDFIIDATGTPGLEGYDQSTVRQYVSATLASGFACVMTTDNYLSGQDKTKCP
jgi:nicotinamidase-related amidase